MPSPPPLPSPTPSPPPEPEREPTPIPWQILAALENERLLNNPSMMRYIAYGGMYEHLPYENVDWDLEGSSVCRVEGARCYGHDFEEPDKLWWHLRTSYHRVHNARQRPFQLTPPPPKCCRQIRQEVQGQITQSDDTPMAEATNDEITPLSEIPDDQGSITLSSTDSASVSRQECSSSQVADDKYDDDSDGVKSIILSH
ncbi:hypothetical protein CFAM422_004982 [Trichoderma lentiforme]|uniref:Uncharacterized protein n=1 Tax=Trichoderma lentiforme TaxID=1567552 RepID=A0A9P4XI19_9HYPO|nr:hypothetical protein CFAM422_004982 [Trichoderma lentiforme]